ncbi:hypothetical protein [Caballeronia cordobensis]|uniref:hypothetical protein n=1 Tax=Caballeronia cordobensis TaxID=1353886 RepID=UPI0006AD7271|nr:hypothetical protein [Caballeronia cordobensis]
MMFFSTAKNGILAEVSSLSPPRAHRAQLIDTKTRREFRTHRYLRRVCAGAERLAVSAAAGRNVVRSLRASKSKIRTGLHAFPASAMSGGRSRLRAPVESTKRAHDRVIPAPAAP